MLCIAGFDGYFKMLNPAWGRVLGWSTEELLSRPWNDFVHPDDIEATESAKTTIVDGNEVYTFENRYRCKDGSYKWLSWNSYPYPEEGIIFGVARDVTKQKEKDVELGKKHEMLVKLTSQMPGVVFQLQLFPDGRMHFPFSSPGMREIFGYSPEEIKENGKLVFDLVHPEDIDRIYQETFKSAENLTHFYCEFRVVLPEKGVEWRLCDAVPERMEDGSTLWYGMIINITQQKEASDLLLRSKTRTTSFLDVSRKIVMADYDENIMQMIVDNAINATSLDTGAIYLINDDKQSIHLKATVPPLPDHFPEDLHTAKLDDHPHIKKAFSTGKLVIMADAKNTKLTKFEKKIVKMRNLRSNVYLPINLREQVIGVMIIGSISDPNFFDEEEIALLQGFADQAAHIINNQFNFKKLQNYAKELESEIKSRLQAENALKLSEQNYRLLFENNPQPMLVYDLGTLNILEINEAAIQKYGYTRDEFLELNIKDIRPTEDIEKLLENIRNDDQELSFSGEWRHKTKDGEIFWVEIISHKLTYKNQNAKLVLINDITKRRIAEDELKFQHELILDMGKAAKVGGWEFEVETGMGSWTEETAHIHEVNPNDETNSKLGLSFFEPEYRIKIEEAINKAIEDGKPYKLELELVTAKGNKKWVETIGKPVFEDGKVVKVRGSIQDISDHKITLDKLAESEIYHRSLLQTIPDTVFVLSSDGTFLDFKSYDESILYTKPIEFLNQKVTDIFPPEVAQKLMVIINESLKTGEVFEHNYSLQLSGKERFFNAKAIGFGEDRVIVTVRDITEYQINLERIKQLLEEQEKQNESLREFTYIISHNLRIHTANILGILLALESEDRELYDNVFIQMIEESSERLETTIRHLIDVLNIKLDKNFQLEPARLYDIVQRILTDLSEYAEKSDVEIMNEISKETIIKTVPDYVEKILKSLLINGIQYSSEKRDSWVRIFAEKEGSNFKISVQDNGIGIDLNKHKERMFGMYVKFHNDERSKGLGLFFAKTQVEALGGRIEVESELHHGSTFTIYLPHDEVQ